MRALRSFRVRLGWDLLPRFLRRLIIGMIGGTILLVGIALLVLPGPAFVVIPLGLLVLATEFVWARRLLQRARRMFGSKSLGSARNNLPTQMPLDADHLR